MLPEVNELFRLETAQTAQVKGVHRKLAAQQVHQRGSTALNWMVLLAVLNFQEWRRPLRDQLDLHPKVNLQNPMSMPTAELATHP